MFAGLLTHGVAGGRCGDGERATTPPATSCARVGRYETSQHTNAGTKPSMREITSRHTSAGEPMTQLIGTAQAHTATHHSTTSQRHTTTRPHAHTTTRPTPVTRRHAGNIVATRQVGFGFGFGFGGVEHGVCVPRTSHTHTHARTPHHRWYTHIVSKRRHIAQPKWLAEERQAFADGVRTKAVTVPDARKRESKRACRRWRWRGE